MSKKLTTETVNERIGGRGFVLVDEYVGTGKRITFRCPEGHEWLALPGSVMRGSGCPHCAGQARLTVDIVNKRIADRGITLIGDYRNKDTKTTFRCSHGHVWQGYPGHVMRGSGCPTCAGNAPLNVKVVNDRLAHRGLRLVGAYAGALYSATFEGDCGHTWATAPAYVMSGTGCPHCAGNVALSTEIVNERLSNRGVRLVGEYARARDYGTFEADCGHTWKAQVYNILAGGGCPICTPRGFRRDDPAILYLIALHREAGDIFKIGVTNNVLKTRYANETNQFDVIAEWKFECGADAERMERLIVQDLAQFAYHGTSPFRNTATTEMFLVDVTEMVFKLIEEAKLAPFTLQKCSRSRVPDLMISPQIDVPCNQVQTTLLQP